MSGVWHTSTNFGQRWQWDLCQMLHMEGVAQIEWYYCQSTFRHSFFGLTDLLELVPLREWR